MLLFGPDASSQCKIRLESIMTSYYSTLRGRVARVQTGYPPENHRDSRTASRLEYSLQLWSPFLVLGMPATSAIRFASLVNSKSKTEELQLSLRRARMAMQSKPHELPI